jgi:hypothetical protein
MNSQNEENNNKLCPFSMSNEYLKLCSKERCLLFDIRNCECLVKLCLLAYWKRV